MEAEAVKNLILSCHHRLRVTSDEGFDTKTFACNLSINHDEDHQAFVFDGKKQTVIKWPGWYRQQ